MNLPKIRIIILQINDYNFTKHYLIKSIDGRFIWYCSSGKFIITPKNILAIVVLEAFLFTNRLH